MKRSIPSNYIFQSNKGSLDKDFLTHVFFTKAPLDTTQIYRSLTIFHQILVILKINNPTTSVWVKD
jgi:hypothetical protein